MKSKDLQKLVLSKYEKGDTTAKIFDDLSGSVSLRTIQRWCKMISQHGSIDLSHPPNKVMVWLGACSKGLTPLVILDKGTVNHERYIKEVLPVAFRYGNKVFGNPGPCLLRS